MTQLVGQECVICQQRITQASEAKPCRCGHIVHRQCHADFKPQGNAASGACPQCGASSPRLDRAPTSSSPVGWEVAIFGFTAILMLVFLIFLAQALVIGPGSAAPITLDSGDEPAGTSAPIVEIETTMGTIRAELFARRAPRTVANFVGLVNQKFYDGIIFHRVIKGFMIQGGDPTGTGRGGRADKGLPPKLLKDEFHRALRHNKPGILSMANSGPDTGDAQFFITTAPTPHLDDRHSIFGKVIEGMDVVREIENTRTGPGDRPVEEVKMIRVRMVPEETPEQ